MKRAFDKEECGGSGNKEGALLVVVKRRPLDADERVLSQEAATAAVDTKHHAARETNEADSAATTCASASSSSCTVTEAASLDEKEKETITEEKACSNPSFAPLRESSSIARQFTNLSPRAISKDDTTQSIIADSETTEPQSGYDSRTGIVFESACGHFDRSTNRCPSKERPWRILSVMESLQNDAILDRCHCLGSGATADARDFLQDEDFLRVHLSGYMQRLDNFANCSCAQLECEAAQYTSVFLTDQSTLDAKRAAASLCALVSRVVKGQLDNGFAVIRPPGHHAEPGMAGGYCLINNVAVAAAFARARLGVQKVLICDWDIHIGNGTQSIFWEDPNVMYFSVHGWHGGNFYPFLPRSGPTAVGGGAGKGYNVNVGWTRKGMGDEEYFAVWERLLMPMAREFEPDLVLVSSGFDAAAGDVYSGNVSPECFQLLTGALLSLAKGRVVCTLEGGYIPSVLQSCVKAVVRALLDPASAEKYEQCKQDASLERQGLDILETIDNSATKSILATQQAHIPYWKCLRRSNKVE